MTKFGKAMRDTITATLTYLYDKFEDPEAARDYAAAVLGLDRRSITVQRAG